MPGRGRVKVMLRTLYDRVLELSSRRHAVLFLALIAFVESSVFPIPPDVMLIPMVLALRQRAWWFAAVCTTASVAGGLGGYAVGAVLFDSIGTRILEFYGYSQAFSDFVTRYNRHGAWIVFFAGVTPFPYKVITIASGVASLDLVTFTSASLVARGLRFFLIAALLYYLGPSIRALIEQRLGLVLTAFCVVLIMGFIFAGLVA